MSESAMWDALQPVLKSARLDPVRIENQFGSGIPDVNITTGWLELKYAREWPVREGPLRVPHYTTEQRAWHRRRRSMGGSCWVMIKVGESEWLLFDGAVAAAYLGKEPRVRLYELSAARWLRKPKAEELIACLRKK